MIIVGTGFAGLQLARQYRRLAPKAPLVLVSADAGEEYAKPLLSHVFSRKQSADDLVRSGADALRRELGALMLCGEPVSALDTGQKTLAVGSRQLRYGRLALALGANTRVPALEGDAAPATLNSLAEYRQHADRLAKAQNILVMGAGLIGCEIAHDLAEAGKSVTLCDPGAMPLCTMLPDWLAERLLQTLTTLGCRFLPGVTLRALHGEGNEQRAIFSNGDEACFDAVLCATGLQANTNLARQAGIRTDRGIVVDDYLQTSAPGVYALGDCAEIGGRLWPFLQPITLEAQALARTLTGTPQALNLPRMPVNVKTPRFPIQLGGMTLGDELQWQIRESEAGVTGRAYRDDRMVGYVAAGSWSGQGNALLQELS